MNTTPKLKRVRLGPAKTLTRVGIGGFTELNQPISQYPMA